MTGARRERPGSGEQPGLFDLPLQPPVADDPEADADSEAPQKRKPRKVRTPRPAPPVFEDEDYEPPLGRAPEFGSPEPLAPDPPEALDDEEEFEDLPPSRPEPARTARGEAPRGPASEAPPPPLLRPRRAPEPTPLRIPARAPFSARLRAVAVDAAIHLGVVGAGALAAFALEVRPGWTELPAFGLFLLFFSFLYSVVPLAFWGRTPGMGAAGLVARSAGDLPLSFGQTGLRWLAALLTAATAGLPLLLALTGRSLADRMSGSETFLRPR